MPSRAESRAGCHAEPSQAALLSRAKSRASCKAEPRLKLLSQAKLLSRYNHIS